ncbi:MAG: hypothetical protein IKP40_09335 [Clostridia bacterium]|nr:hypothetical protein [Clostridia bacterium]
MTALTADNLARSFRRIGCTFSCLPLSGDDPYEAEIKHFIAAVTALLDAEGRLQTERFAAHQTVTVFDIRGHLYPLLTNSSHFPPLLFKFVLSSGVMLCLSERETAPAKEEIP